MSDNRSANRTVRRIEVDPRTDEFITLFQRYGETVLAVIAKKTGRAFDPVMLARVNREVEPMLRNRVESLVKDYLQSAYERLTGEAVESEEVGYRVRFPRRRRYHLRFLTLSFADLVAFGQTAVELLPNGGRRGIIGAGGSAIFAKSLLEGVDLWTRQVLDQTDLESANMTAFRALDRLDIDTDGSEDENDRDLWRRLHSLHDAMALVCPVLLPLLQPFHQDFEAARTQMQRLIGVGSRGQVQLNAKMWDLLFARMFGRLLRLVGGAEREDLASQLDEGQRQMISEVMQRYRQWRAENHLK